MRNKVFVKLAHILRGEPSLSEPGMAFPSSWSLFFGFLTMENYYSFTFDYRFLSTGNGGEFITLFYIFFPPWHAFFSFSLTVLYLTPLLVTLSGRLQTLFPNSLPFANLTPVPFCLFRLFILFFSPVHWRSFTFPLFLFAFLFFPLFQCFSPSNVLATLPVRPEIFQRGFPLYYWSLAFSLLLSFFPCFMGFQ